MKAILLFFIFFQSTISYCQFNFRELSGVIKIKDSLFIPYNIYLNKTIDNKINGYSITDKDGPHETKSTITGSYTPKENLLEFNEFDILYTKSPFDSFDFCFIHFTGKIKNFEKSKILKGVFLGKYANGTKCIDGTLLLADKVKIEAKIEKLENKFNKPRYNRLIEKIPSKNVLDSMTVNRLSKNENLNVFWKSDTVKMSFWDLAKEDGDMINVFHNGKLILRDHTVENSKKYKTIKLKEGQNVFKVVALNEGEAPPNTSQIELLDGNRSFKLTTNLSKNEFTTITIIKSR